MEGLGGRLPKLAEVEDKTANCNSSIDAYLGALKVYILEEHPIYYAITLVQLGEAFQKLAEMEDTVYNCRKSIAAYEEALKVFNLEQYPMEYSKT